MPETNSRVLVLGPGAGKKAQAVAAGAPDAETLPEQLDHGLVKRFAAPAFFLVQSGSQISRQVANREVRCIHRLYCMNALTSSQTVASIRVSSLPNGISAQRPLGSRLIPPLLPKIVLNG